MSKIEEIDDVDTDETYTPSTKGLAYDEEDLGEFKGEELTNTIITQIALTKTVNEKLDTIDYNNATLRSDRIVKFLKNAMEGVNESHQSLDSSKVWISFWILNGLDVLNKLDSMENVSRDASDYLARLQNVDGGFGGGNSHTSHVVSTFAAVSAIYSVGTEEIYRIVNRQTMYSFLMRMKTSEGAFRTEIEGESDSRSTYCAIAVASMLNILTDELISGVPEFLESCQTYEGGFGAYPGNEAHGGYTFCAVAALSILKKLDTIDMESLHRWITFRQTEDGGFQGRTNKLVDTCYSYWQGGAVAIIQSFYKYKSDKTNNTGNVIEEHQGLLFNQRLLQEYLLICCQNPKGGFSDHPTRNRDYYHTCYGLSGLSLSQHNDIPNILETLNNDKYEQTQPPVTKTSDAFRFNGKGEIVEPIHPVYNIKLQKCALGLKYFHQLPSLK